MMEGLVSAPAAVPYFSAGLSCNSQSWCFDTIQALPFVPSAALPGSS